MNSRRRFKMKALLIGLLTAKIGVTLIYLTGTVSISKFFFTQPAAIAQEKPTKNKEKNTDTVATAEKSKTPPTPNVDITAVLKRLDRDRKQIERERENIEKQRAQLDALKQEIEEKIDKLSKIQQQIVTDLAKKEAIDDKQKKSQKVKEDAKIKMLVRSIPA